MAREIREELDTTIRIGDLIETVEYDYPDFHLSMDCFWCEVIEGNLVLLEAQEARWLTKEELDSVKWLPADLGLIDRIGLLAGVGLRAGSRRHADQTVHQQRGSGCMRRCAAQNAPVFCRRDI